MVGIAVAYGVGVGVDIVSAGAAVEYGVFDYVVAELGVFMLLLLINDAVAVDLVLLMVLMFLLQIMVLLLVTFMLML